MEEIDRGDLWVRCHGPFEKGFVYWTISGYSDEKIGQLKKAIKEKWGFINAFGFSDNFSSPMQNIQMI